MKINNSITKKVGESLKHSRPCRNIILNFKYRKMSSYKLTPYHWSHNEIPSGIAPRYTIFPSRVHSFSKRTKFTTLSTHQRKKRHALPDTYRVAIKN